MAVITISRQFGSGGISVAEIVAEQLGYKLYDRRLLNLIAKETNVSTRWVEYFDKQLGSKFHKILTSKFAKRKIESIVDSNGGFLNEGIYIEKLTKIINLLAEKGDAVIVGRASQYILNNISNVLHILLVSDKKDRINFLTQKYGMTHDRANQIVNDEDLRRLNLYRLFGKEDFDDAVNYNIVINMSKVSLKSACTMICNLIDVK